MGRNDALNAAVRQLFMSFAKEKKLGEALAFGVSTPTVAKRLFMAVFVLAMVCVMSVVAFSGESLAVSITGFAGLAIMLWLLAVVVIGLVRSVKAFIGVYEGGFIHQRGSGDMIATRWDEVRSVMAAARTMVVDGRERHTYVNITLVGDHSKTVLNEEFADVFQLLAILDRKVSDALLPAMVNRLKAGKPVEFGEVILDRTGIRHHDDRLPWEKVRGAGLVAGKVEIWREDTGRAWVKIPTHRFPNTTAFQELVKIGKER